MKYLVWRIIFLGISFVSLGQESILRDTNWHIEYIVLDGETYTSPIVNAEGFVNPNIAFESDLSFAVLDPDSDSLFANITYDDANNQFTFNQPVTTLFGCFAYCDFASLYFELLTGNANTVLFDYGITFVDIPPESLIVLTITDSQGNIAVYNDAPILGQGDFNLQPISIYPNPTKDILFIAAEIESFRSIIVYNAIGERIKPVVNLLTKEIDISLYPSGLYFVVLQSNQDTFVQKIIKR